MSENVSQIPTSSLCVPNVVSFRFGIGLAGISSVMVSNFKSLHSLAEYFCNSVDHLQAWFLENHKKMVQVVPKHGPIHFYKNTPKRSRNRSKRKCLHPEYGSAILPTKKNKEKTENQSEIICRSKLLV